MNSLKTIFVISLSLFCLASTQASQTAVFVVPDNDTTIYTVVDEMPQFPGGDSAMVAYITNNVHYPQTEKEKGIQGKVFVGFVVEKDGGISNVEIKRGISTECDTEAIRAVKGMPNWEPGKQSGVLVRTAIVLPISFKIVAPPIDTTIYDAVEKMPSFPGGTQALFEYLKENVTYPEECEETCVQGRVIVSFVVERDGCITEAKVVKSVYPSLDEEALRVVNGMPKWMPGKQNGNSVRTKYTIPINFRLQ